MGRCYQQQQQQGVSRGWGAASVSCSRGYSDAVADIVKETRSYDELKKLKGVTEIENPIGTYLVRDAQGGQEQFDAELAAWIPIKKFENAGTLEWQLASPPPFHSFDEPLAIKFTNVETD